VHEVTRSAWAAVAAMIVGSLLGRAAPAVAQPPCLHCVTAGAGAAPLVPPPGTPLAGYGGFGRRALFPDLLGRHPHAFWFTPSDGELDPVAARALVVESSGARLIWIAVDLVAVDREFTAAVARRLAEAGTAPATLIVSATHTHSGPGAFGRSRLWAFLAVDRFDAAVRAVLLDAVAHAVRAADATRTAARVGDFSLAAPPVTASRLGLPTDPEVVGLKVVTESGRPLALLWNYAIHGTMLGARNHKLSGDVMGVASRALERALGAPALFVNGAVGDIRPRRHGREAALEVGDQLAHAVGAAWTRAETRREARLVTLARRVELPAPGLSLRNCLGRYVPRALTLPLSLALPADAELTVGALGGAAWVTMPGELQARLGGQVKRAAATRFGRGFVAGLSNDYLGYFVTAEDYDRPGYVTCASLYGPEAGERLAAAAGEALRELGASASPGGRARAAALSPGRPAGERARTSCGRRCSGG
jgi:hypothetical protein